MANALRAAACIVGYNHWFADSDGDKSFTRDFVTTLHEKNPGLHVVLVDNASSPPYPADIVETARLERRVGYGTALNVGLLRLLPRDFDWYITFNNDCWIDRARPCDLLSYLAQLDPTTLYGSGWNEDPPRHSRLQYSAWLCISREILRDVGLFDMELEAAFEDFDYELRAMALGYSLATARLPNVEHMDEHTRYEDKTYADRWEASRLRFQAKHGRETEPWFRLKEQR